MLSEVRGIGIVNDVVERSDNRTAANLREGELARGIKRCVDTDGNESSSEREGS